MAKNWIKFSPLTRVRNYLDLMLVLPCPPPSRQATDAVSQKILFKVYTNHPFSHFSHGQRR